MLRKPYVVVICQTQGIHVAHLVVFISIIHMLLEYMFDAALKARSINLLKHVPISYLLLILSFSQQCTFKLASQTCFNF